MRSAASDADRYHIPPTHGCAQCGELAKEHHYNGACYGKCGEYVDPKSPLGLAKAANARASVDLAPFVAWFRDELSRERTAAADAKCEARGHREEVVKLEAMLRAAVAERAAAMDALEHARCDAKDAQQMLMDERAKPSDALAKNTQLERDLAAVREACMWGDFGEAYVPPRAQYAIILRESAFPVVADYIERIGRALTTLTSERVKTPREELTPGTPAAVIEAYRLLVGDTLEWKKPIGWYDNAKCDIEEMETATYQLIRWLDKHAPGGKP
jgi:hypothetical protein